MKASSRGWGGYANAKAILAVAVLLGGASMWWAGHAWKKTVGPAPSLTVSGSLAAGDLREIRRTVEHEVWSRIIAAPNHLDWPSIRWWLGRIPHIPQGIRDRERIESVSVNPDASVTVRTRTRMRGNPFLKVEKSASPKVETWGFSGSIFTLKKGPRGWRIISSRNWIS